MESEFHIFFLWNFWWLNGKLFYLKWSFFDASTENEFNIFFCLWINLKCTKFWEMNTKNQHNALLSFVALEWPLIILNGLQILPTPCVLKNIFLNPTDRPTPSWTCLTFERIFLFATLFVVQFVVYWHTIGKLRKQTNPGIRSSPRKGLSRRGLWVNLRRFVVV